MIGQCGVGFGKLACADLRNPEGEQTFTIEFDDARKLGYVCRSAADEVLLWNWIGRTRSSKRVQKMTKNQMIAYVEFLNTVFEENDSEFKITY